MAVGAVRRVPPVGAGAPVAAGLAPVLAARLSIRSWSAGRTGAPPARAIGRARPGDGAAADAQDGLAGEGHLALAGPGGGDLHQVRPVRADVAASVRLPGPVHVFNPQGIGGVPSTFRWNPLRGCEVLSVAIRRADAFAHAVSQKGVEDATFWAGKASDYLRAFFHAAALGRLDMRRSTSWVMSDDTAGAEEILRRHGNDEWAAQLAQLRGQAAEDRRDDPDDDVPGAGVHGRPAAGRVGAAHRRPGPGYRRVPGRERDAVPGGRGGRRRRGGAGGAAVRLPGRRDPLPGRAGRVGACPVAGWTRRC